jgi:hypothetical protein
MKKTKILLEEKEVKGDSPEVMTAYYTSKLRHLHKELDQLNILEHPVEILSICTRIQALQIKLQQVNQTKNRRCI